MDCQTSTSSASAPSASRQAALINLLADEDPAVYETVRKTILSGGPEAGEWLRLHALSSDPVLRRRAREIIRRFDGQTADIRFLAFCLRHGEEFDLEEGVWLLAATEYPDIKIEGYQAVLDGFASELRERIDPGDGADQVLGAVNQYLFDQLGFTGNEQYYYDPENSYLNRVMDRRTGNPINLCLIYMFLARRLRLPVAGIGLPGHFICRYQSSSDEVYIDVFNRGRTLTKADCIHYLVQGSHGLHEDFLVPASARRMLTRICTNLHQVYLQIELEEKATQVQRYLVALNG